MSRRRPFHCRRHPVPAAASRLLSAAGAFAVLLTATALLAGCDDFDRNTGDYKPPQDAKSARFAPPPRGMRRGPAEIEDEAPAPDFLVASPTPTPSLDAGGDPLSDAPKMPTAHSHWLRGDIEGATVTVTVNGALLGDLSGAIDRDITMLCRPGVNQIAFAYHPAAASGSSARLQVLESEHDPPVPPLATFQRSGSGGAKAVSGETADGGGEASSSDAVVASASSETDLFTAQ